MKCPKCKKDVPDNAKTCPYCKKLLKLVCPQCNNTNDGPICKKCGFVILSKCSKCGTITPTVKGKCSKCGFDTYESVQRNCANIDDFACVTLDFPNLEDIKEIIGSKKLIEKFVTNLDNLITDYCSLLEVKREIIDGTYVIRFNKSDSFAESALEAINFAIELGKKIINLNFKLSKTKGIYLDCKIAVLKRSVKTPRNKYQSGFDIKLVADYGKEFRYLNYMQVITDAHVYQEISDNFSLESLSSSYINGEMVTFFELKLKKHMKVEPPKEEEVQPLDLKQIEAIKEVLIDDDEEKENRLYNKDIISFDDMKCSFHTSNAYEVGKLIADEIKNNKKRIFSIKSVRLYKPESDLIFKQLKNNFKKMYQITCSSEMKYKPYGFFSELLYVLNNLTRTTKLSSTNNMSIVSQADKSGVLNAIINLTEANVSNYDETRLFVYKALYDHLKIQNKILIYINDFEKIDESSYEILQLLWKDKLPNVTFILSSDTDFSVHKTSHFLLQDQTYSEIRLKPLSIKKLVEFEPKRFKSFTETYYFQAILHGMKGSLIFFNNAIEYLKEKGIITDDGELTLISSNSVVIPSTLEYLIEKRLQFLMSNKNTFKLFSYLIMMSPMNDLKTVKLLEIPEAKDSLKYLQDADFINVLNGSIRIKNYDTIRKAFDLVLSEDSRKEIAMDILGKIAVKKMPEEISLYNLVGDVSSEIKTLENLSKINASLGEFSAYLNCVVRLLKLADKSPDREQILEKYRTEIYENISKMLNKYTPNKIYNISKQILNNLEKTDDTEKIIKFSLKMLKISMTCGNYNYTFELLNKLLARLQGKSLNPNNQNFSPYLVIIMLIRVETLFAIGRMRECEETSYELLNNINSTNFSIINLSSTMSKDEFKMMFLNSMTFVLIAKAFLLRNDDNIQLVIDKLKQIFSTLPKHLDYILPIKQVLLGKPIEIDLKQKNSDEGFLKIIKAGLRGFTIDKEDYNKFANDIYEAKICSNINNFTQLEILCDLLIGYAYFKLGGIEKAKSIYYSVLEMSQINGYRLVGYLACYLLSMYYYETENSDMALSLANNTVSQIEQDNNVGDYLFYLFRVLTSGIYTELGDDNKAFACMQSAVFVKQKDEVEFGLEGVDLQVEERRIKDRRQKQEDTGGRRKGQRRIKSDDSLLKDMEKLNNAQFEEAKKPEEEKIDFKNIPNIKVEEKKSSMFDDIKTIADMNLPVGKEDKKEEKEEKFNLLKGENKKKEEKSKIVKEMEEIEENKENLKNQVKEEKQEHKKEFLS